MRTAENPYRFNLLRGNYSYLDYYGWVEGLLSRVGIVVTSRRDTLVEYVFRYAMSPSSLLALDLAGLRHVPEPWGDGALAHTPDVRLGSIRQLLDDESGRVEALAAAIDTNQLAGSVWDGVCAALDSATTGSRPATDVQAWTEGVVAEFARRDEQLGPYVILAWLLPAFLRRHFTDVPIMGTPRGWVSCRSTDGHPNHVHSGRTSSPPRQHSSGQP